MKQVFSIGLFALVIAFPLAFTARQVHAQQSRPAAAEARIDGFDVKSLPQSSPGRELEFALYGSPGGIAAVQIDGATAGMVLVETEAGVYEGTYTIRSRDKITARSSATANLRVGNNVATTILDEPLIGKATARRPGDGALGSPRLDRFEVDPANRLVAGEELGFTLYGTPGGTASARVIGIRGKLVMPEVNPGVYEGSYTLKNRDQVAANAVVTGNLRIGNRETNMVLGKSLLAGAGVASSPRRAAQKAAPVCAICGTVQAVNVVEVKGEGTYLGKIAGGLAGVLLGSQVGSGRGTTVAEVAGAVGGAYAGNEVEKRVKTTRHYEVIVHMDTGGSRNFSYPAQPGFAAGAKVKVENGTLVAL